MVDEMIKTDDFIGMILSKSPPSSMLFENVFGNNNNDSLEDYSFKHHLNNDSKKTDFFSESDVSPVNNYIVNDNVHNNNNNNTEGTSIRNYNCNLNNGNVVDVNNSVIRNVFESNNWRYNNNNKVLTASKNLIGKNLLDEDDEEIDPTLFQNKNFMNLISSEEMDKIEQEIHQFEKGAKPKDINTAQGSFSSPLLSSNIIKQGKGQQSQQQKNEELISSTKSYELLFQSLQQLKRDQEKQQQMIEQFKIAQQKIFDSEIERKTFEIQSHFLEQQQQLEQQKQVSKKKAKIQKKNKKIEKEKEKEKIVDEKKSDRIFKTVFIKEGFPFNEENGDNVEILLKTRREKPTDIVDERLYSSLKYVILQKATGSFVDEKVDIKGEKKKIPFLLSRISVVDAESFKTVLKSGSNVLKGTIESSLSRPPTETLTLKGELLSQFISDISYHHQKKEYCLEINYFLPPDFKNPVLTKRSPSFKVFARKPNKKKNKKCKKTLKRKREFEINNELPIEQEKENQKKRRISNSFEIEIGQQNQTQQQQPQQQPIFNFYQKIDELFKEVENFSETNKKIASKMILNKVLLLNSIDDQNTQGQQFNLSI